MGILATMNTSNDDPVALLDMLNQIEAAGFLWTLRVALDEIGLLDGKPTYGEYTWRPGFYELWLVYVKIDGTQHGIKQEHYATSKTGAVASAYEAIFGKVY